MKETDIAYLAGLLEGEGCFSIIRNSVAIRINMTDYDVLEKAQSIMGGKIYGPYTRTTGNKSSWYVHNGKRNELRTLLPQLLPYMGKRRSKKIENCIWLCENEYIRKEN